MKLATIVALFATIELSGCAGSLDSARTGGLALRLTPATTQPTPYCLALDERHAVFGGVAKGAAILSGASGLATLPVNDDGARLGLAIGALAAGSIAASSVFVAEDAATRYVRDCSTP